MNIDETNFSILLEYFWMGYMNIAGGGVKSHSGLARRVNKQLHTLAERPSPKIINKVILVIIFDVE